MVLDKRNAIVYHSCILVLQEKQNGQRKVFTRENIGESHPEWLSGNGNFTQVIVRFDGKKIAHFFGPFAKTFASKFMIKITEK